MQTAEDGVSQTIHIYNFVALTTLQVDSVFNDLLLSDIHFSSSDYFFIVTPTVIGLQRINEADAASNILQIEPGISVLSDFETLGSFRTVAIVEKGVLILQATKTIDFLETIFKILDLVTLSFIETLNT